MTVRHVLFDDHEIGARSARDLRFAALILTQAGAAATAAGLDGTVLQAAGLDKDRLPFWVCGVAAFLIGLVLVVLAGRRATPRVRGLRAGYFFADFGVSLGGVVLAVCLTTFLGEAARRHDQSWHLFTIGVPVLVVCAYLRAIAEGRLEDHESGQRRTL